MRQLEGHLEADVHGPRRGQLELVRASWPSELVRRAVQRIDRRAGPGMRRGGRGAGGTRADVPPEALVGLTNFSSANYFATQSGGGEPGVNTGFGVATLLQVSSLAALTANHPFADCSSGATGWVQYLSVTSFYCGMCNSTPAFVNSSLPRVLVASDVGKLFLFLALHTGAGNLLRVYIDRDERGTGTTVTGYSPASAPHSISDSGQFGGNASSPLPILAHSAFRGVPTLAQIQAYFDAARILGDLPDTIQGATITHHWSARRALLGSVPVSGQAAPASLTDNITGAAANAMTKQGAPTIAVIDPSIDGRKTYGALGWSASNYLETAAGAGTGIVGSSGGFYAQARLRIDAAGSADRFVVTRSNGSTAGFLLRQNNTVFEADFSNGTALVVSPTLSPTSYVGRVVVLTAVYDQPAGKARLYVDGVEVGTGTTIGGYVPYVLSSATMQIGRFSGGGSSDGTFSVFDVAGGNFVPSAVELAAQAVASDAAGVLVPLAGKTDHHWSLHREVLASGAEAVPAQVLDRVGTDHLTRQGIDVRTDANSIRAIGPWSTADCLQSVAGGGVAGATAGFHVVVDLWFTRIPATSETITTADASSPGTGWYLAAFAGGTVNFTIRTQGVGSSTTASFTVTSGDLNVRKRFVAQWTGSALQLYVNGVQIGSDVAVAWTFTPVSTPFRVGGAVGINAFGSGHVECVQGGNTVLTPAEIATLNANLTAAPPVVSGKTQKRYVFELDIAAANGGLPVRSVERISGGDDLVRIGSPLQIAARVERVWSYETIPILYGGENWTFADYFAAAINAMPGESAGFTATILCRLVTQSVASNARYLFGQRGNLNQGWNFATTATNTVMLFGAGGNVAAVNSPSQVLTASDVGKLLLFAGVWDGASARLYAKRQQAGNGTVLSGGYAPDSSVAATIGRVARTSSGLAAEGWQIYGVTYAVGVASLAQIQAHHDLVMATERIQPVPGLPGMLVDLDQSSRAAGGAVPTTLPDLAGSAVVFNRNGNPTLAPQYARAWGW